MSNLSFGLPVLDGEKSSAYPNQEGFLSSTNHFIRTNAVDHFGGYETFLLERFVALNRKYFEGRLPTTHLKIGRMSSPRASLGQFHAIGDHGVHGEIVIDDRIFRHTSRHVAWDDEWSEGLIRFLNDVLLHQMVHLHTELEHGADACGSAAHGSAFAESCAVLNGKLTIGADGMGPFTSIDGIPEIETGTWWPMNRRGFQYYQGVWIPPRKQLDASPPCLRIPRADLETLTTILKHQHESSGRALAEAQTGMELLRLHGRTP